MSKLTHKRHNISVLMYHLVCPAKYRRAIFTPAVVKTLTAVCLEIEQRFEIEFLEIGTDQDPVHFIEAVLKVHYWRSARRLTIR